MKIIIGWVAVVICTLISSACAFWGSIEGFHEGWYHKSLLANVIWVMLYLIPALAIAGMGIVSIRYPKIGMTLCTLAGVLIAIWVLKGNFHITSSNWSIPFIFTAVPILLGLMFLLGDPNPKRLAMWIVSCVPILVIIASGSPMAWRVMHRIDDGNRGSRIIKANDVSLEWVGEGPGWSRSGGTSWYEARRRCDYLSADGTHLATIPQRIWRLPTVDELVTSMSLHNHASKGKWNASMGRASYILQPDKETPLWDPTSEVTYYWSNTEKDNEHAYWIVYNGNVFLKQKDLAPGNVGFRAVRSVR